ncbi:MAG TPA: TetR/AcrR family transcriptional regulator [Methanocellaceae archaeon]
MKKKEQSERTRLEVLGAAVHEMHRNGFRSASLENILATTKLSKGALYHHFSDKRELGYAVIEEYLREQVYQFWIKPLDGCEDPVKCLGELITRNIEYMPDDEVFYGCLLNSLALEMSPVDDGFRIRINQVYELWEHAFVEVLEKGQANGTVSKDIEPSEVATFIVATLAGARSLSKNEQSREPVIACGKSLVRYLNAVCKPL